MFEGFLVSFLVCLGIFFHFLLFHTLTSKAARHLLSFKYTASFALSLFDLCDLTLKNVYYSSGK